MQKNNAKVKLLMEDLLKAGSQKISKIGDVVEGVAISKEGARLYVNLLSFGTGVVYGREFYEAQDLIKSIKPGDVVSGKVVDLENKDGYVELSLKEAGQDLAWEDLESKKRTGEIFNIKITDANKGGLVANLGGVSAFMPVSQLLANHYPRVEGGDKSKILQELSKFVGETFKVKIIDIDKRENKLIISEKSAQDDDMTKILDNFKVGDIVDGEVSGIVDFGVFVKFKPAVAEVGIKEVEGLVHISELDWQLIDNPADVVTVGDKVKAKIISVSGSKISLSIKALKKDPWDDIESSYKVSEFVKGKVTKINPFGAFVKLDANIHGLCHISEFGNEVKMKETLKEGSEYDFTIQSIKKEEHRMALGFGKKLKKEDVKDSKPDIEVKIKTKEKKERKEKKEK
ncbi:MAG: S1 RNA-binding domain-containing protein [Patescibacteria group bacterium]